VGSIVTELERSSRLDDGVATLVELALLVGAAATIGYWVVLVTRLPALAWYPVTLGVLLPAVAALRHRWRAPAPSVTAGALAAVCLAAAAVSVFTLSPDADDLSYLHSAFVAAAHPELPIPLYNTIPDVEGLPALSPVHLLTSVEFSVAMLAHGLDVDALWATHYAFSTLAAAFFPVPYFLLMRRFGLSPRLAVLGAAGALAFLLLSENPSRDWGNFTILHSWVGKCLLIGVLLPITTLVSVDFMRKGGRSELLLLCSAMVAGLGCSGSGAFLIPFVIYPIVAASLVLAGGQRGTMWRRGLFSLAPLFAIALAALLPLAGLIPNNISNIEVWQNGWPQDIPAALTLVLPWPQLALLPLIGAAGLLLAPDRRLAAVVGLAVAGMAAAIVVPPVGLLIMKLVQPGAFWRLVLALPVPLCFGLVVASVFDTNEKPMASVVRRSFVGLVVVTAFVAIKVPAGNYSHLSWPQSAKLDPGTLPVADELARLAPLGAVVLSPESIAVSLGLMRPDIRFISGRDADTLHIFLNAHRTAEGQARVLAQRAVTSCAPIAPALAAVVRLADFVVPEPGCETTALAASLGPDFLAAGAPAAVYFRARRQ
jgi:hypothetical protein